MRDHLLDVFAHIAQAVPDTGGNGGGVQIAVAAIGAVAGILTAVGAFFIRKPDEQATAVVKVLREDLRVERRKIELRDAEITRLQGVCWRHDIDPATGRKVPTP